MQCYWNDTAQPMEATDQRMTENVHTSVVECWHDGECDTTVAALYLFLWMRLARKSM
jgi:hypothetical protein|eukprot:COSAG06_NODE_1542_length_9143_cov_6.740380_9_plen_57_part_00